MSVLVRLHLRQAEHCVLALPAVVVRLLAVVRALRRGRGRVGRPQRAAARLRRRELVEARRHDGVQLLVLAPVGHHLVRVRAVVVALQAVEVAAALLLRVPAQRH